MLNKKHVRRWVKELRSGRVLQGQGLLQHNGRYCCLGVACKIAPVKVTIKTSDDVFSGSNLRHDQPLVAKWLGITPYQEKTLVYCNDTICLSFNEIADQIEEMLHKEDIGI